MATYFHDITSVFDVALRDFGIANTIDVARENSNYKPSVDKPYLASYVLLADTEQADLFFTERRAGILQIDINYASARGSADINKMADLLNYTFRASAAFQKNDICAEMQSVSLGPLIVENGWAKRPLSINFVAYTQRL